MCDVNEHLQTSLTKANWTGSNYPEIPNSSTEKAAARSPARSSTTACPPSSPSATACARLRGTQFRQWATARLSEYLVKGFTMDDERLKNPPGPGVPDYFDELLERIRDIRASERRVYLRVREILALAADYAPTEPETQLVLPDRAEQAALRRHRHDGARADRQRANAASRTWG